MAMGFGGGRLGPRGFLTEEEKKNMPKVDRKLILRILSYLKPYTWQFVAVFVTIIVSSVIGLLPSMITGKIVDQALVGEDLGLLIKLLLAGATTTQVASCLYRNGIEYIKTLNDGLQQWMQSKGYTEIGQFKGKLALQSNDKASMLMRTKFMNHFGEIN